MLIFLDSRLKRENAGHRCDDSSFLRDQGMARCAPFDPKALQEWNPDGIIGHEIKREARICGPTRNPKRMVNDESLAKSCLKQRRLRVDSYGRSRRAMDPLSACKGVQCINWKLLILCIGLHLRPQ